MYEQIIELLDQRRLKEALIQLQALASEIEDWQLSADIENLATTYTYMLQYASQGMKDPERPKMYHLLRRKTYKLTDKAEFLRACKRNSGHFADKCRRMRQNPPHTFQELCIGLETLSEDLAIAGLPIGEESGQADAQKDLFLRHEQMTDELFDKIWTSTQWTEEEFQQANAFLSSLLISANDLAVMVSAVTLSSLRLFDNRKFQFLLNTYQTSTDILVNQRALIGIALIAYYQEKRLSLYPDLLAALSLLGESKSTSENMLIIQTLLLLSRETEKIEKKMREEIIPQMMRTPGINKPDLKIIDIEELEDKNPEWSKNMAQIEKSIRELGELQMEGADTYMSTFAQLKGYPFFRQAAHWFYPFDKQMPEISSLFQHEKDGQKSLMSLMMDSPIFCNSDKYSFCLTLFNLPAQQREMLTAQAANQSEIAKEQMQALADKLLPLMGKNAWLLLKGGHLTGHQVPDLLTNGQDSVIFNAERIDTKNTHGTGCTLSSAVATLLPQCTTVPEAVEKAKKYLWEAISHSRELEVGHGHGPVHHFYRIF